MGWQRRSGYDWRALVEADVSKWKRVIGDGLRFRTEDGGVKARATVRFRASPSPREAAFAAARPGSGGRTPARSARRWPRRRPVEHPPLDRVL